MALMLVVLLVGISSSFASEVADSIQSTDETGSVPVGFGDGSMDDLSQKDDSLSAGVDRVDGEKLGSSDVAEDKLGEAAGNFTELNNVISADDDGTVDLYNNYTRLAQNDHGGYIVIDKELTIDGHGNTLDANSKTGIFSVNTSSKVVFKNLIFTKSYSPAIKFLENATTDFINCSFISNGLGNQLSGGAINFHGTSLNSNFINVNFTENRAYNSYYADKYVGGALYFEDMADNNMFVDVNFVNNFAGYGGSIYFNGDSKNNRFINATFKNKANPSSPSNCECNYGGAIYFNSDSFRNNFTDCTFEKNQARYRGGAIYFKNMEENEFNNVNFTRNLAYYSYSYESDSYGGAIYVVGEASNTKFADCTFENNRARCYGGGIYFAGASSNISFINGNFNNNINTYAERISSYSIDGGGSAVAFKGNAVDINFSKSNFTQNSGYCRGTIVFKGDLTTSEFTDLNFEDNFANMGSSTAYGGAISISGVSNNDTFKNINFTNNGASGYASGNIYQGIANYNHYINLNFVGNERSYELFHVNAADSEFRNISFINNYKVNTSPGPNYGITGAFKNCVVDSMNFINNTINALEITSTNNTFNNIYSFNTTCTLYLRYAKNNTISNSKIENKGSITFSDENFNNSLVNVSINPQTSRGVYVSGVIHNLTFDNVNFTNCVALRGAAFLLDCDYRGIDNLYFRNVNFIGNNATGTNANSGGGAAICIDIYQPRNPCENIVFENVNFKDNHAYIGGAIYDYRGSNGYRFYNVSFINNTASDSSGGAITFDYRTYDVVYSNVSFIGNKANEYGGAIALGFSSSIYVDYPVNHIFDDVKFIDNSAKWGGAFFMGQSSTTKYVNGQPVFIDVDNNVTFKNSVFMGNNATSQGGALWIGNRVSVIDCNFTENIANQGSVFYLSNYYARSNGIYDNLRLTNNSGIAVYACHSATDNFAVLTLNFTNSIFDGNRDGYVLYGENTDANLINCSFTNNNETAIHMESGNLNVKNGNFINNSASDDGGAIYLSGFESAFISNVIFNNNSANNGGAIYLSSDGKCIISDSYFSYNCANSGAAISYNGYSEFEISNTEFFKNKAESLELYVEYDKVFGNFLFELKGGNNYINAIQSNSEIIFDNVTYWEYWDTFNSDDLYPKDSNVKANQKYVIEFYKDDVLSDRIEVQSDDNCEVDTGYFGSFDYFIVYREEDDYYTAISEVYGYTWGDFDELQRLVVATPVNGVLNLTRNFTYTIGLDTITKGIWVVKNITIEGNNFTIDALYMSRIFRLATSNVVFQNINFVNATGWDGAFIYGIDVDNVSIINCTFDNVPAPVAPHDPGQEISRATKSSSDVIVGDGWIENPPSLIVGPAGSGDEPCDGGAVYIVGSNLNILNSNFTRTFAINGGAVYFKGTDALIDNSLFTDVNAECGGAIFVNGSSIIINNSTFDGVFCNFAGGAIYINGSDITVSNSLFMDVDCDYGGAIYIDGQNIVVASSNFTKVSAGLSGGAIYALGSFITVRDSSFEICHSNGNMFENVEVDGVWVNVEVDDTKYGGGAISLFTSDSSIINSSFINCDSTTVGGAVYAIGNNNKIEDSNFTICTASYCGGAVYVDGDKATLTGLYFNSTGVLELIPDYACGGGAVCIVANNSVLSDSQFKHNLVTDDPDAVLGGGAIMVIGNNVTIKSSNFTENFASAGGAIFVASELDIMIIQNLIINESDYNYGLNVNIEDCIFENNMAFYGGAIYWMGKEGVVSNSNFVNNTASIVGGAVEWAGTFGEISNCNFTHNFLGNFNASYIFNELLNAMYVPNGGVILPDPGYIDPGNTRGLRGSDKDGGYDGGNEYPNDSNDEYQIYDFDYSFLTPFAGGAVYVEGLNLHIIGSRFTDNYAPEGGAVDIYCDLFRNIQVDSSYVDIFSKSLGANAVIEKSVFEDNFAHIRGGAIAIFAYNATVIDSQFYNNSAYVGGAIDISSINSLIEESFFENNNALMGGAIISGATNYDQYLDELFCSNNTIFNSTFIDNHADYGGAIFSMDANGIVDNSTFKQNKAVYNYENYIAHLSKWFSEEEVAFIDEDTYQYYLSYMFELYFTTFSQLFPYMGGAIQWFGDDGMINNSWFINNSADYGGAVLTYNTLYSSSTPIIDSSRFIENYANIAGGAIFAYANYQTVSNSYFDGNYAISDPTYLNQAFIETTSSGAILWTGSYGMIYNSEFVNNYAMDAGAVLVSGDNVTISSSRFSRNHATRGGAVAFSNINSYGVLYKISENNTIVGSTFEENFADLGGALYLEGANIGIDSSRFFKNNATSGGAVYYDANDSAISGSEFTFNTADRGSAIYAKNGYITVKSTTLLDNKAKSFSLASNMTLDVRNVVISILFRGNDNLLNAIYSMGRFDFDNVTYWGVNGIMNTGKASPYVSNLEAGQNITLEIIGSKVRYMNVEVTDINGKTRFVIPNVPNGRYYVAVSHNDDNYYSELSNVEILQVGPVQTPMEVTAENIVYGENSTLNVNLVKYATGNVTVYVDGEYYGAANLTNGSASITLSGLNAGTHNVSVAYSGNEEYNSNLKDIKVYVSQADSSIVVMTDGGYYKEDIPVSVIIAQKDATGDVVLVITDNYGKTIPVSSSEGSTTMSGLTVGKYTVEAYYKGNNNYRMSSNKTSFEIKPIDLNAEVNAVNDTNGNVFFTINVPYDFKGKVNITFDGISNVYDIEGSTEISFENLTNGTRPANFSFYGDNNYNYQSLVCEFTACKVETVQEEIQVIEPAIIKLVTVYADNLTRGWNSPYDYQALFLDEQGNALANTIVSFKVANKEYLVKTNDDGIAQLTQSKLAVGSYDIVITNLKTGEEINRTVEIVKRLIESKDMKVDYASDKYYVVKVIGDDGNVAPEGEFISVYLAGVYHVVRVNATGYANLNITAKPNTYNVIAEYKDYKVTNKLVVKQTLKLVKKTIKVKKGKKIVLKAKLKWSNGTAIKGGKIVFKLKGIKYVKYTNSKGLAKVTIKKKKVLKMFEKGKKYKFTATYIKNTVKGTVKIKKK